MTAYATVAPGRAVLNLPGLHVGPVEILAANIDGTMWVQSPQGGPLMVSPDDLSDVENAPAPVNTYGLTPAQIEVLAEFAAAGRDGLADFEHSRKPAQVAEHRRVLLRKCLVAVLPDVMRTSRTQTGDVWAITRTGQLALQADAPKTPAHAATA